MDAQTKPTVRAVGSDPMVPRLARVVRRWREALHTWTIEIESDPPRDDPTFEPGQFNMLYVFGVGEIPISMNGDPAASRRLRHTVRAVGQVSAALTRLRPGDAVGLRGPFGTSWPMATALGRDVIIVAGGLGLAPLRPAICRILAERERYGRVSILYGTRSPDEIYHVPIVVTGFEPLDILEGAYRCIRQLEAGRTQVENQYSRSVRREGNRTAQNMLREVFRIMPRRWRGIGEIPASGLGLTEAYADFNAERRFGTISSKREPVSECISGFILRGERKPPTCPAFGTRCTPEHPLGATMVSSEGACAAYYRHHRILEQSNG